MTKYRKARLTQVWGTNYAGKEIWCVPDLVSGFTAPHKDDISYQVGGYDTNILTESGDPCFIDQYDLELLNEFLDNPPMVSWEEWCSYGVEKPLVEPEEEKKELN